MPETSSFIESNPDLLDTLVQTDYDFLEESCTLFESLALDVEEFRHDLAQKTCYAGKNNSISCLNAVLQFIEHGSYPPIWRNPIFDDADREAKEKGFAICKAALIKAVVEVFGEGKNDDVLWTDTDSSQPGGPIVSTMVRWIQEHARTPLTTGLKQSETLARDDMAICASLSLGNLARKGEECILRDIVVI